MLNSTRLLFDLQQVNDIAQSISGCLDAKVIAHRITDALVTRFDCAFARMWLTEPDQQALALVASSGLYTHTNGSFARVPMGAYKVGKIAQNQVPFLSNHLAEESWVKDRNWAIENNIQGFAGYPLVSGEKVLGVLATFSHHALAPEFLEVLQILCLTTTIALDAALEVQQRQRQLMGPSSGPSSGLSSGQATALSDQLVGLLTSTRLMLVGTERPLPPSMAYVIVRATELLNQLDCSYCRLTYGDAAVSLEGIVAQPAGVERQTWLRSYFDDLHRLTNWLGGTLQIQPGSQNQVIEFLLQLSAPTCPTEAPVYVHCQASALQVAFTHLCRQAGLSIWEGSEALIAQGLPLNSVVLTDRADLDSSLTGHPVIWIHHGQRVPSMVQAVVEIGATPEQLGQVVSRVRAGETVGLSSEDAPQALSEREHEIMTLLAQGLRDRDIAQQLHISESTVKFHVNNTVAKLKAKNRYQAVYEAAIRSWI